MHTDFIELSANLRNEHLLKAEASFTTHKRSWSTAFTENFKSVCADIAKAQAGSTISAISCLEYTMLYTNFINQRYVAEVWAYDDKQYLDKKQKIVGEYDTSFLFVHFEELWDKLLAHRKRYFRMVSPKDVTSFMLQVMPNFYSYLANIAKYAIPDCIDEKPLTNIAKNDIFKVRIGDYMAQSRSVFTLNKTRNTNVNELVYWFSERSRTEYNFQDFSDLDFSSRDFSNTVFRYVQFLRAILNNTNLESCSLTGASFRGAQLENCNLNDSAIYEADFSYASMKNASFLNVRGKAGLLKENEWQQPGFLPVSFRNADLTCANFKWADLSGADFTGACLANTNFSCAVLDNAVFSAGDLPLSEYQKSKIIISGRE